MVFVGAFRYILCLSMIFRSASSFVLNRHCYLRTKWRKSRLALSTTPTTAESLISDAELAMRKVTAYYQDRQNPPLLWTPKDKASSYFYQNFDTFLFDCDGVLYRTPDAIPNAKDCIENLMTAGKTVLFVTNNAGVNREELREKLSKTLNVQGLRKEQMISSSYSAAQYLKEAQTQKTIAGNRVHVIGSPGLCNELSDFGFSISTVPSGVKAEMNRQELADYDFQEHPIDALVVGHDIEFTFRKLSIANVLLQKNPEAILVATNRDSFDLVGADGRHIPGNGCLVTSLEYCSRRSAVNVGKPSGELVDLIRREHNLDLQRTVFVGDRLDTDIKFGVDTGMATALVLTGVTTAEKLIELGDGTTEEPLPTAILLHVGMLV